MAELRFRNASRSLGHICVVFCGENMGWEGRTVPTAYWVESQPRWAQIHRTTGEESNIYIHTHISCFSFWSHSLSLTPVLSMTSEHLVQIHIQTKLSFLSVHFPSDSLQKSKWDHLWTERWLLCSWVWSEGIQAIFKPSHPSELEFTHISWVFHSSYGKKRLIVKLMGCFLSHRKALTGRRTVCFRWTRALSETPTVFSLYWGETGSI